MLIKFHLHPSNAAFPDIQFGEAPGRVIVELDQGEGGPFVTTVKDGKRKSLYSASSPGPNLAGIGTRRFQLTNSGKYFVSLRKNEELWLRIIAQKGQPNIYDLEIGADTLVYNRFVGKFRIRGLKLSSLKIVDAAPPEASAPTLWDRLGTTELDENP